MAQERKRVLGELAAWQIAGIAAMFGGQVSPSDINPYRVESPIEKAQRAANDKRKFWLAMGVGLFGKATVFAPPADQFDQSDQPDEQQE